MAIFSFNVSEIGYLEINVGEFISIFPKIYVLYPIYHSDNILPAENDA